MKLKRPAYTSAGRLLWYSLKEAIAAQALAAAAVLADSVAAVP
jgi:hypothetical protein